MGIETTVLMALIVVMLPLTGIVLARVWDWEIFPD